MLPDPAPFLRAAGLTPRAWRFDLELTQQALSDWLKIPPLTDVLLPGLDPTDRAERIDEAYERADTTSWRHERWLGWTAYWRNAPGTPVAMPPTTGPTGT